MNDEQLKVVRELGHEGYAVIIWSPEELGNARVKDVEDRSIELGYDIINSLSDGTAEPIED